MTDKQFAEIKAGFRLVHQRLNEIEAKVDRIEAQTKIMGVGEFKSDYDRSFDALPLHGVKTIFDPMQERDAPDRPRGPRSSDATVD